jgi:hypothetical protein
MIAPKPKLTERKLVAIVEETVTGLNDKKVSDAETYESIMRQLEEKLAREYSNFVELDFDGCPFAGDIQAMWVRFEEEEEEEEEEDEDEEEDEEDEEDEDMDMSYSDTDSYIGEEYEFSISLDDGEWDVDAYGWT